MKLHLSIRSLILAAIAAVALYVAPALATLQTISFGSAITEMGPLGLQIDLGIGHVPGITTAQVVYLYNIISFGLVIWIAFVADQRSSTMYCMAATLMAAFCAWTGWFTTPNNPGGQWGLIVLCAVLSGVMYLTEAKRTNFGVNMGGDPTLNILLFVLLFQATIGLVNGVGMFNDVTVAPTPQVCGNSTYSNCQINGNVQLQNAATNTGSNGLSSGSAGDMVATLLNMGWDSLKLIFTLLVSIFAFPLVVLSVYPWMSSSPAALLALGMFYLGVWVLYALTMFRWIFKPLPGEGRI